MIRINFLFLLFYFLSNNCFLNLLIKIELLCFFYENEKFYEYAMFEFSFLIGF